MKGPGVILKKVASYLYRVKIKSAAMVDNYSHLKKCADQGISLWLARYREKFWKWVSVPQESTGQGVKVGVGSSPSVAVADAHKLSPGWLPKAPTMLSCPRSKFLQL